MQRNKEKTAPGGAGAVSKEKFLKSRREKRRQARLRDVKDQKDTTGNEGAKTAIQVLPP